MKQVILTGDRPTGQTSCRTLCRFTERDESNFRIPVIMMKIYIMIADAQALTDNAEHPEKVRQNIIQVALDYLACGIDPAEIYYLYPVYGTGADRTDFLLYESCYGCTCAA